jgi:Zn-dependent peptidase ImmA (M78 family)
MATTALYEMAGGAVDGLWCVDERIIYIRKGLSLARVRHIYGHELQHALVDACHAWEDGVG